MIGISVELNEGRTVHPRYDRGVRGRVVRAPVADVCGLDCVFRRVICEFGSASLTWRGLVVG